MTSAPLLEIERDLYLDRILGLWQGKFIGGTLGAPIEGVKDIQDYDENLALPSALTENDDTDLQILWLHALQEHGVRLTAIDLMHEWREHMRGPWNEYGVAWANWERGLVPPDSGRLSNWFWGEGMGCPIRAEIWGSICPGSPYQAAHYAALDGSLDHTAESIEAEKFIAALVAGAFLETDLRKLIVDHGLPVIAAGTRFRALVTDLLAWTLPADADWRLLRRRILTDYGHPDMTHVLQNLGFTLLALLLSRGHFRRAMMIALNCGYDTDCTAGIAGAIIGATRGSAWLGRENLAQHVDDRYVVSDCMLGLPPAGSLAALTQSCLQLAREVATVFDTGISLPRPANEAFEQPLAVRAQPMPPPPAPRGCPFPSWKIYGPFWRNWDERRTADLARGEHGNPNLPSAQYFSHVLSGFDRDWLDVTALADCTLRSGAEPAGWTRDATDNRLPLDHLAHRTGPLCYYAATWVSLATERPLWLTLGSTGPIDVWWNGRLVVHSETHQALTPNTFAAEVQARAGKNSLILKLARAHSDLAACIDLRRHAGRHWHQCFYETDLEWLPIASV